MELTPFVDSLQRGLAAAAATATPEVAAAAERLAVALDPATRLMLMEALAQASAEITSELDGPSVETRLRGRDLDFVVTHAPSRSTAAMPTMPTMPLPSAGPQDAPVPPTPPAPPEAPAGATDDSDGELDGEGVARVSLRLPESVKARAERRAQDAGQSLNTWLVSVVRRAAEGNPDAWDSHAVVSETMRAVQAQLDHLGIDLDQLGVRFGPDLTQRFGGGAGTGSTGSPGDPGAGRHARRDRGRPGNRLSGWL